MQGNDSYRLVMRRGPQPNQVFELTGEVTNLGRDITNDITINDREVSRHHLRLVRGTDGSFTIEDLGSTNGTFVNGKRVSGAMPLKNGDIVGLGETVTLGFEVTRPGVEGGAGAQPVAEEEAAFRPQPPPAASENPYQPQAPSQAQAESGFQAQPAYQAPAQSAYQPDDAPQYAGEAAVQSAYGPPPPGYDYDPYAMREGESSNLGRYLLFGCLGLLLVCCCVTVIAAVAIDTFDLYCQIPVLGDVVEALGLKVCT